MQKYFIIKADDFKYNNISNSWLGFLNCINDLKIPAALGLIGKSLESNKPERYNNKVLELIANHEIFAHGYHHDLREYLDHSVEEQKKSIIQTLELIKNKLNLSVRTFGAPGNNISKNTKEALIVSPVNIWLYGMDWERLNLNKRNFEFEYSDMNKSKYKNKYLCTFNTRLSLFLNKSIPGNCNYHELLNRYQNKRSSPLIMGQIHPAIWSDFDLNELKKFLKFVLDEDEHKFITPQKYFEKVSQKIR